MAIQSSEDFEQQIEREFLAIITEGVAIGLQCGETTAHGIGKRVKDHLDDSKTRLTMLAIARKAQRNSPAGASSNVVPSHAGDQGSVGHRGL